MRVNILHIDKWSHTSPPKLQGWGEIFFHKSVLDPLSFLLESEIITFESYGRLILSLVGHLGILGAHIEPGSFKIELWSLSRVPWIGFQCHGCSPHSQGWGNAIPVGSHCGLWGSILNPRGSAWASEAYSWDVEAHLGVLEAYSGRFWAGWRLALE